MSDPTRDPSPERAETVERRGLGPDDTTRGPDDTAVRPAVRDDDWLFADGDRRSSYERGAHERDVDGNVDGDEDDGGVPEPESEAHPVAVPLAGFFTGMLYVLVLPALWFLLSDPNLPDDLLSVDIFYFVPAILVPVVLAVVPRTRKFGRYMLLGVVLSAFVVVGVAAVVVSVLIFSGA